MPKKKYEYHGLRNTPEYNIWNSMKQRCVNPRSSSFKRYGAVGITVCDRWKNSFASFYQDMGPRPSKEHSVERIDNLLGYSPENCRWATPEEQANNTKSNLLITAHEVTQTAAQWEKDTGVPSYVIRARIHNHGWSPERAVSSPVGKQIYYKGRYQTLAQWCRELNLEYYKVQQRIKKLHWLPNRAFEK